MEHLLVEDDQPRRPRQQDLFKGGEQRKTHVLVVHDSIALDHVHELRRVGLHPIKYWVQALVLGAIHHRARLLPAQQDPVLVDSPVRCQFLVGRVSALAVLQI